jgi:hypothetical protein
LPRFVIKRGKRNLGLTIKNLVWVACFKEWKSTRFIY